jgi:hypothetical protein
VTVEDTVRFFHEFVSKTLPPDSDPFTVKPEDRQLPTTWDRSKIVYFPVMADAQSTSVVPSNGGTFYYSLWTQNLTAYGGWKADHVEGGWHPRKTQPIQIRRGIEGLGQHEATLATGALVTVVDYSAVDYVLYLHGTETCPPNVFDPGSCRFALTTRQMPADARSLSSHMQMVIGVRLRSYPASYFGMTRQHDATPEARNQSTEYRASIEADFAKILLLDISSGQIVAEWDALPDKSAARNND